MAAPPPTEPSVVLLFEKVPLVTVSRVFSPPWFWRAPPCFPAVLDVKSQSVNETSSAVPAIPTAPAAVVAVLSEKDVLSEVILLPAM